MSVLGTAGAMVTTHENSVMIWSFKGPNCFAFCKTYWKWKRSDGFHIMVSTISLILIRIWVESLIGKFILEVTFSIRLGPLRGVPTAHCAGRRGSNLLTVVRPVELAQCEMHMKTLTGPNGMSVTLLPPILTGVKQCTFHWLISSELVQKQRVVHGLITPHLIIITGISYGNIFAI